MSRWYDALVVDDLRSNVTGAAAAGMTGVHHSSCATTAQELPVLLGLHALCDHDRDSQEHPGWPTG